MERNTARRSRLITGNALVARTGAVQHRQDTHSRREPRRSIRLTHMRTTHDSFGQRSPATYMATDTARWHGKRSSHGHVSLVQYACDRADLATCESLQQLLSRQARRRGYYGRPHAAHIEGRARCDILVVFRRIGRRLGLRFRLDAACERSPRAQCAGQERASRSHAQGRDGRAEARVGQARDSTAHSSRSLRVWG